MTMQYALLIYSTPEASSEAVASAGPTEHNTTSEWIAYTRAVKDAGALVTLARLQSVETATSVRVRGGERLLTDGPFVETKEHLLGFYLVEAPDLDTAIEWAGQMPLSRYGAVEVRPLLPTPILTQIAQE
jgi:hypothetical protein